MIRTTPLFLITIIQIFITTSKCTRLHQKIPKSSMLKQPLRRLQTEGCKKKTICKPKKGKIKCTLMKVCSDNKLQKERLKKCPKNRKYPPTKYLIQPYEDEDGYDIGEISYIAFSSYEENGYYAYVASDKEQTSLKLIQFSNGVGNVVAILKLNLDNTLSPFEETDWEDVSLGPCDTKTEKECIYIANTGSNNDDRDVLQILKIYEPDLANLDLSVEEPDVLVVDPITVNYSYGEGFNEKYNDGERMFTYKILLSNCDKS